MMNPIRIAISTDARGYSRNATLIASIVRRTKREVSVRCYTRGFSRPSFSTKNLTVEFIRATEDRGGRFPGYVSAAVFDRLQIIHDAADWDRALIMDYDQLALRDLGELFDMDMGRNLLAAKMHGDGVDLDFAMKKWRKEPMPEGYRKTRRYPYFTMGPLLNLKEMRKRGTWEKLLAAHKAFNADEQIALTAATEGRTMALDPIWNLFPRSDFDESTVPEGVIHWLGWPKPWHMDRSTWRVEVWEAESCNWEMLRNGLWTKPEIWIFGDVSAHEILELACRGWKIKLIGKLVTDRLDSVAGEVFGKVMPADPREKAEFQSNVDAWRLRCERIADLPDVEVVAGEKAGEVTSFLETSVPTVIRFAGFRNWKRVLDACPTPPDHVVFGPSRESDIGAKLKKRGYVFQKLQEVTLGANPIADGVDYLPVTVETAIPEGFELHASFQSRASASINAN